jgi:hypothetical protein
MCIFECIIRVWLWNLACRPMTLWFKTNPNLVVWTWEQARLEAIFEKEEIIWELMVLQCSHLLCCNGPPYQSSTMKIDWHAMQWDCVSNMSLLEFCCTGWHYICWPPYWHRPSAGTGTDFSPRAETGTWTSPYWHRSIMGCPVLELGTPFRNCKSNPKPKCNP